MRSFHSKEIIIPSKEKTVNPISIKMGRRKKSVSTIKFSTQRKDTVLLKLILGVL
jgi:hypothetical protein